MNVALVTGASSGFGLLAAVELARQGFVVFAGLRTPSKREALDQACREARVQVEVVPLDITRAPSISACLAAVQRRAGRLDVDELPAAPHPPVRARGESGLARPERGNTAVIIVAAIILVGTALVFLLKR